MPTISDFTKTYEVQTNTIRHWAANFADFLSPGANPGKGQRRIFNQEDATVIALIGEMRQEYKSYQEITAALAAGDRGQWPPESNQAGQDGPEETQSGDNRSLALITQLTAKASSLEGELKATKVELERRLAEIENLENAKDQLQAQADRLRESAASAETELRILKEREEQRRRVTEPPVQTRLTPPPNPNMSWWQRLKNRFSGSSPSTIGVSAMATDALLTELARREFERRARVDFDFGDLVTGQSEEQSDETITSPHPPTAEDVQ